MKISEQLLNSRRSELLVSVRSLAEAWVAAAEEIDILDFKEPLHGPLAPVESSLWHEAAARFRDPIAESSILLSAALGESDSAPHIASQVPDSFSFAKAGPYGCASSRELRHLWATVRAALPEPVELVAVAYADSRKAHSLEPEEVIESAHREGFRRVLIDTFVKDGRSSVEHLTVKRLREIRHLASHLGIKWMLAGAIRQRDLDGWLDDLTRPDGFGVRGDVCQFGRTGEIDSDRIRCWRNQLDRLLSPVQASHLLEPVIESPNQSAD